MAIDGLREFRIDLDNARVSSTYMPVKIPTRQGLGVMAPVSRRTTFDPLCYTRDNLIPCQISKLGLCGLLSLSPAVRFRGSLSQFTPRAGSPRLPFSLTAKPAKDDMSPLCCSVSRDLFPEWL